MQENLLKTSFINNKEDLNGSTSQSSRSSSESSDSIGQDLYRNVLKQMQKNQEKLQKIIKENPAFIFDLYKPTLNPNRQIKQKLNVELLQKQLDRLMEDDCQLEKQISKITFFQQENEELKEKYATKNSKNLSMLQTIWMKPLNSILSEQRVDQLNLRVVTIKNHIKQISMLENHCESIELQKYVFESKDYCQLKLKYQKLNQEMKGIQSNEQTLKNKIQELENQICILIEDNKILNNKVHEQSAKLKKKDQQIYKLTQKCHQIELQIIKKQKQLKKIPKQIGRQQMKMNPQKAVKQIKFVNKIEGLTITIQSAVIQQDIHLPTTRILKDIKNYLINTSTLDTLIQSKLMTPKSGMGFARNSDFVQKTTERPAKRNFLAVAQQSKRQQIILGSHDKRKRFERTKIIDE